MKKLSKLDELLFLGIDPGKQGAMALIDKNREVILIIDWPGDEHELVAVIGDTKKIARLSYKAKIQAGLEKVHSMPGQGVTSMFSFGMNYGMWRSVLASFNIPFILVPPRTWQKGIEKSKSKTALWTPGAKRLFPNDIESLQGPRGGAKDGRAVALLIADWCRRQFIK